MDAASKAEGQQLTSGTVQAYFPLKTQPQCDSKRTLRTLKPDFKGTEAETGSSRTRSVWY